MSHGHPDAGELPAKGRMRRWGENLLATMMLVSAICFAIIVWALPFLGILLVGMLLIEAWRSI